MSAKRRRVWTVESLTGGLMLFASAKLAKKCAGGTKVTPMVECLPGDVVLSRGEFDRRTANAVADWLEAICNQPQFHNVLDAERLALARQIRKMTFAEGRR